MSGTNIYMITGTRQPSGIGYGGIYPDGLNADSVPNPDGWGPDEYWTPTAYINWFEANKQQYGLAVAQNKMLQAIDNWGLGGVEFGYAIDTVFTDYFENNGIDVSTIVYDILHAAGVIVDTGTTTVEDTAGTLQTITGFIKTVAPFALVGAALYGISEYVIPSAQKIKSSIKK